MTSNPTQTIEAAIAAPGRRGPPRWPRLAGCVALALVAAMAAGQGGALGAAVAALAALGGAALAAWPGAAPRRQEAPDVHDAADAGAGARLMARAVLPVWRRQIEASKTQAEQGNGDLLAGFSRISDGLEQLAASASGAGASLDAGAAGELVERNAPALDALLAPMLDADRQRQRMLDEIACVGGAMAELAELGKELRALARHTGLVALNASIEANRAGHGGGAAAIAIEVRTLAGRAGDASERLCERLAMLGKRVETVRREAELSEPSQAQARLQVHQQARAVVRALLADAEVALSSAGDLRELGGRLRADLETVFMAFQHQDRLDQMLSGIGRDIGRFEDWLATGRPASHADAARWLDELERTYTMEEQRSRHHGTVEVSRVAAVEFF